MLEIINQFPEFCILKIKFKDKYKCGNLVKVNSKYRPLVWVPYYKVSLRPVHETDGETNEKIEMTNHRFSVFNFEVIFRLVKYGRLTGTERSISSGMYAIANTRQDQYCDYI